MTAAAWGLLAGIGIFCVAPVVVFGIVPELVQRHARRPWNGK